MARFHITLIMLLTLFQIGESLEPLAILNALAQPVWQAGDPMSVNVNFDGNAPLPVAVT